jgi:excisionase family DNA binding protein
MICVSGQGLEGGIRLDVSDDERQGDLSERWLSAEEAAERLGVSVGWVRRLCKEGKLPGATRDEGAQWRIPENAVEARVKHRQATPGKRGFWKRLGKQLTSSRAAVAFGITVFGLILTITLNFDALKMRLIDWGAVRAFPAARADQTLIIVVAFDYVGNIAKTQAHLEIKDAIEDAREETELTEQNTPVVIYPVAISNEIDLDEQKILAEKIGELYNASFIIWGSDSGVKVTVNFLNLKQPDLKYASEQIEETTFTQFSDPSGYAQFIIEDLPKRLTFLSLYSIGYAYYQTERLMESIRIFDKAIELDHADARAFNGRGNAFSKNGDKQRAIADYDKALELDAQYVGAYINRGNAYLDLGNKEQSLADFSKAIELDPKDPEAYLSRAGAYIQMGDLKLAIADLSKVIELDPEDMSAYHSRGIVFALMDDLNEAIIDFNKAIELSPKNAIPYASRGLAYAEIGNLKGAITEFTKAINLDRNYDNAYSYRGRAYHNLGKCQRAITDYDKAIELDPDDVYSYYNRGIAYFDLSEYQQAIADYGKAIELEPINPIFYNNRGRAYEKLGKYMQAIEDYDKAIALDPSYSQTYAFRGGVYTIIGEYQKATSDFQKYLELVPDAKDRLEIESKITELQTKINQP